MGFNLPIGASEFKASYARYRREPGAYLPQPTTGKFALGYVYNLWKRSAIYATAAWLTNSDGAAQAHGGVLTSPDHGSRGTEFGLRHAFYWPDGGSGSRCPPYRKPESCSPKHSVGMASSRCS